MNSAKHYSKNDLQLKSDVPGAKMWAVALEMVLIRKTFQLKLLMLGL